jgi:hypothetical protein
MCGVFGKIKVNIAAIPTIFRYIIILIQNTIFNQLTLSSHESFAFHFQAHCCKLSCPTARGRASGLELALIGPYM